MFDKPIRNRSDRRQYDVAGDDLFAGKPRRIGQFIVVTLDGLCAATAGMKADHRARGYPSDRLVQIDNGIDTTQRLIEFGHF